MTTGQPVSIATYVPALGRYAFNRRGKIVRATKATTPPPGFHLVRFDDGDRFAVHVTALRLLNR